MILLEDFKKCLSERIVVYLNEQKVSTLCLLLLYWLMSMY